MDALLRQEECWVFTESYEMSVQTVKNGIIEVHIVLYRTSHKNCTVRHSSEMLSLQKQCCIVAHKEKEGVDLSKNSQ